MADIKPQIISDFGHWCQKVKTFYRCGFTFLIEINATFFFSDLSKTLTHALNKLEYFLCSSFVDNFDSLDLGYVQVTVAQL